jgi:site-specific DNA-methyltransferase (adenine-specific)
MIDLRCGDCLEIMKDIPDESIDLIVTDPPYLIKYKTCHRKNKSHDFCSEILNDDNYDLISNYIKECYRILKKNTAMYMFCNCDRVDFFKQELEKAGFKIKNMIIWVKNNWTAGDLKAQFGKQYEIIFLVNKGRKNFNGKRITDIWKFNRVAGKQQLHQNQKPLDLIEQCILKHSNENDLIFDGFMGSGSTGVACINTNRNFIGIELDEKYFNIAKERIENAKSDNS